MVYHSQVIHLFGHFLICFCNAKYEHNASFIFTFSRYLKAHSHTRYAPASFGLFIYQVRYISQEEDKVTLNLVIFLHSLSTRIECYCFRCLQNNHA